MIAVFSNFLGSTTTDILLIRQASFQLQQSAIMSAQALKMRNNLEKIKKEREVFEEKKRQLDAEMTKGRTNMTKIKKGLRNNEIVDSPMDVTASPTESQTFNVASSSTKQLLGQKKSKYSMVAEAASKSPNGAGLTPRPASGPGNKLYIINCINSTHFKCRVRK